MTGRGESEPYYPEPTEQCWEVCGVHTSGNGVETDEIQVSTHTNAVSLVHLRIQNVAMGCIQPEGKLLHTAECRLVTQTLLWNQLKAACDDRI